MIYGRHMETAFVRVTMKSEGMGRIPFFLIGIYSILSGAIAN